MPFGIVGRTGPEMRQVVGFGDLSTGRGTIGGEFGARHCNQWGLYGVRVRQRRDAAFSPNTLGRLVIIIETKQNKNNDHDGYHMASNVARKATTLPL